MSNGEIAEKMGRGLREISVAEFFEKNRHLLGFDNPAKALLTVVKEGVDNSLDACEDADILPEITVRINQKGEDRFKIIIQDNGPGIVKEKIARVFGKLLYGSKFYKLQQSLTYDEPILILRNGKADLIEIGKLVDNHVLDKEGVVDVFDLNIKVPSFDHKLNKYSYKRISHVIKHKRRNEIYEIKTWTNRKIKVTGCHSLFGFNNKSGKVENIEARNIEIGDKIVIPSKLPEIGNIREINILDYITPEITKNNWFYIYGVDKLLIKELKESSEIIHKRTDKSRKYYRLKIDDGFIDILDDSMKQYERKLFLPMNIVLKLGLNSKVSNCVITSYHHGNKTEIPVTWELNKSLMRFLGLFIAEGHSDKRQVGFTFGLHEDHLVDEISQIARRLGASVTIETRESTYRVKVFGGMISLLLPLWCGKRAENKIVPEFVFRTNKLMIQYFIDALYEGDGHNTKSRNQLMLSTVSKKLANQVLYLWLMRGVTASIYDKINKGLGKTARKAYVISVYGKNIEKSLMFKPNASTNKKSIVTPITIDNGNGLLLTTDISLVKVKEIKKIDNGYDYVYDISVPKCENFVGGIGGISCHNSRGQQGIGISAAVLYSQLTTGKPVIIRSRISKSKPVHEFHLRIDTVKNEPHIVKDIKYDGNFPDHGIYIEMEIEGSFKRGKRSVDEYMKQTALANPAAKISYRNPYKEKFSYPRIISKLPRKAKSIKPHPYGVELGVFERMAKNTRARSIAGFMNTDFSRVSLEVAKKICRIAKVRPSTPCRSLGHAELEKVWRNLQRTKLMKPPLDCLSPIGHSILEKAVLKDTKCEFVTSITRPPAVYRGNPFGIEVCIGYGGELPPERGADINRIANRVPLIHEASACAITKAIKDVDWRHYRVEHNNGVPTGPFIILVHMYSTWIPYTSEGKEAIDAYPEIFKEIKLAIQDCARRMARFLAGKRKRHLEKQRQSLFEKYIPELAISLENLSGTKKSIIITGLNRIIKKPIVEGED